MEEDSTQFGMTEGDVKKEERQELFTRIKSFFASIWPPIEKILSSIVYYTVRFIKAFVSASLRMVMGKEV